MTYPMASTFFSVWHVDKLGTKIGKLNLLNYSFSGYFNDIQACIDWLNKGLAPIAAFKYKLVSCKVSTR